MEQAAVSVSRAIGPAGTLARVVVGLGLLALAIWVGELAWYDAVGGLAVLPGAMLLWQWLRSRRSPARLAATGGVAFYLNFAAGAALLIVPFTREAAALFYGSSMLLAAVRGYAGCEVTSISNWLLRRDDQVGCVVFSPIDAAEARASDR